LTGITIGCLLGMIPLFFDRQSGEELRAIRAAEVDLAAMVEQKVAQLVDADRAVVYAVDVDRQLLVAKVGDNIKVPLELPISGTSFVAECCRSGEPLKQHNLPPMESGPDYHVRSVLCMPVFDKEAKDRVVGVVEMLNKKSRRGFTEADVQLSSRYATMLTFLLQGRGSYDILSTADFKARRELSSPAKADMFRIVVDDMSEILNSDRSSLYLMDPDRGELFTIAAQGRAPIYIAKGAGLAGHVAETGKTLNLADAYESKLFDPSFDASTGYVTKSVLVVPVQATDGSTLGVLQSINKKDGSMFSEADVQLVVLLAACVASTLEEDHQLFASVVGSFRKQLHKK